MQMTAVRIFFEKTGRARYVSHLDTMRTATRALRRSGLPLWYTEGFNPHLYLTFALPLSLGYEGLRESFDVRILEEPDHTDFAAIAEKLNAVLPPGFRALDAAEPAMKPAAIALADYTVSLAFGEEADHARERFADFCAQPAIEVLKKTKKAEKTMDIKPLVSVTGQEWTQTGARLELRCAAGITLNINPSLFLDAFFQHSQAFPRSVHVVRTRILTEKEEVFC